MPAVGPRRIQAIPAAGDAQIILRVVARVLGEELPQEGVAVVARGSEVRRTFFREEIVLLQDEENLHRERLHSSQAMI